MSNTTSVDYKPGSSVPFGNICEREPAPRGDHLLWGMKKTWNEDGLIFNARIEKVESYFWKNSGLVKDVMLLDGFWEESKEGVLCLFSQESSPIYAGILRDSERFVLVTQSSVDYPNIARVHRRMPYFPTLTWVAQSTGSPSIAIQLRKLARSLRRQQ